MEKSPFSGCKLQVFLSTGHLRPIPTKWEISRKISFPSYNQIHVVHILCFHMIYYVSGLLLYLGSKTYYFLEKFLCFLLKFDMFSEPYLL